ncbi:hypothetical protein CK203_027953 [Vitis vinifera]|uniref:Uncharacterized protein n=1 Tax=Vitis vinifera TaxID=29760 RepID=A0A438J3H9_VITVI|nr:hypothetical protein CK203_027953 [Vitis vinifera]
MSDSLLEKYKGFNARLPVIVAETLLRTDPQIELPLWLVHMFKVGTPLLSYLGLPLGAPYKSDSMGWGRGETIRMSLEQIQRDFLRGGGALERKLDLVGWSVVCTDKSKGGLG